MGMIDKNLCDSCTNIGCIFQSGIVRTKCAFYMPPHIEPDNCGNYVVMQPTVEAIPKADYENRLKADMVAMLTDISHEIQETEKIVDSNTAAYWWKEGIRDSVNVIQSRIAILKIVQEKEQKNEQCK